jgi:hypothetical protein
MNGDGSRHGAPPVPVSRWTSVAARCDKKGAAVVLTAVLLGVMLVTRVVIGGGLSAPVMASDAFVGPDRPADLKVVNEGSTGYDGQFVYRLALDPFTRAETAYGITLDNPPYRQQRIGLPLAAWGVARTGLPLSASLLLVNAAALLAAAWAGAVLARRRHRHALWGVLVALSPGLVVAVNRDLTEPLQIALLLAGLVAWTGRRTALTYAAATAAFTTAAFTRETTLAVLCGLGLWELARLRHRPDRGDALVRAALLLVPLAAITGWQLHLENVWGELPIRATEGDVGAPFVQTAQEFLTGGGDWSDWTSKDALLAHAWVAERVALAALLAYTAVTLGKAAADPRIKAGWVLATLLALSTAWGRDVAFLRAANEAIVLAVLVLLGTRTRSATAALAGTAALSCYVGVVYAVLL